ncbi:hypothetical protein Moror_10034 [Moniliophthora roreri MCA 2997]|uniref:Uncharacterized protein n=1 Tax=Moniliophthora roreri (strain MCA 2997) TaxID=1381753 RepID=V2Y1S7_MONRO|nr:hypothetical protein Moror_10034 [Moniliophthora roreri MCA 2997]
MTSHASEDDDEPQTQDRERVQGHGLGYSEHKGISHNIASVYIACKDVSKTANAFYTIHDAIAICNFLIPYCSAAGDTHKFKPSTISELTNYLNNCIIVGSFKKKAGVSKKIKDGIVAVKRDCAPFQTWRWEIYDDVLKLYSDKQKGDHRYSAVSDTTGVTIPGQPSSSAPPVDDTVQGSAPLSPVTGSENISMPDRETSPAWDDSQIDKDIAASSSTSQEAGESTTLSTASETPACKPLSQKCFSDGPVFNSVKRVKITPADGLQAIGNAMSEFSQVFGTSMGHLAPQLEPSPVWRSKAMGIAAEKEESWLSICNQMKLGQHLESTVKADAYLVWAEHESPKRKA